MPPVAGAHLGNTYTSPPPRKAGRRVPSGPWWMCCVLCLLLSLATPARTMGTADMGEALRSLVSNETPKSTGTPPETSALASADAAPADAAPASTPAPPPVPSVPPVQTVAIQAEAVQDTPAHTRIAQTPAGMEAKPEPAQPAVLTVAAATQDADNSDGANGPNSPDKADGADAQDSMRGMGNDAKALKIPSPSEEKGAPQAKDKNRLFGTMEIRGPIKNLPQWINVQERHKKNPIFTPGFQLNSRVTWDKLKELVQGKSPLEKIKAINSFWNQWPYKLDSAVYGKPDYWAAPYEFRKNSGDCEDYAIVKYFTLKELGFPVEQMRIVVVTDSILNVAHAILAVYLDDDIYILDNIAKNVLSHSRIRNYKPHYSVNEQNRWVHLSPK